MSCPLPRKFALVLCLALAATGCFQNRPAYWNDPGALSHYLDQATELEHPDVHAAILDEVTQSRPPITAADPAFDAFWDLTLEEAVSIALQNAKVIRGYGTPGLQGNRVAPGVDNLSNGPAGAGTMYNIAVRKSEPGFISQPGQINSPGAVFSNTSLDANQGVEAALADFDAQFTSSLYWDRSDTPRNTSPDQIIPGSTVFFQQDAVNLQSQLAKKTAEGTQLFLRQTTSYTANNIPLAPVGFQALRSVWQAALEFEVRQPLSARRGAFVNRMPVVISRIGTDQELANLESQLQNMVTNIEVRYWDLYAAYRALEAAKDGRETALATWRIAQDKLKEKTESIQPEAQARERYFFFDAEVNRAWAELLDAESNLRFLLGIAATDSRLIRPIDEPLKAPVEFDYGTALDEAITLRPELRQERWEVKKRQLALAYSKNSLLPSLNAVAQYRWLGLGDKLVSYDDATPNFPAAGSGAVNDLFGGNFQEFRLGLEYAAPVGFRREMANVTNAELKLARELARLEDMELDTTRELQHALRALKTNYTLAQRNFNRWIAADTEVESETETHNKIGKPSQFELLEAQRRRSEAELAYYQSLVEYNKVIALIHRRKGTSLAYCGVYFDEGPWAGKAYCDAAEYARKRSASLEINYGWSRPEVISRGPMSAEPTCDSNQTIDGEPTPANAEPRMDQTIPSQGSDYYVPGESLYGSPTDATPSTNDTSADRLRDEPRLNSSANNISPTERRHSTSASDRAADPASRSRAGTMTAAANIVRIAGGDLSAPVITPAKPHEANGSIAKIKWKEIDKPPSTDAANSASAVIRQVSHEEQ